MPRRTLRAKGACWACACLVFSSAPAASRTSAPARIHIGPNLPVWPGAAQQAEPFIAAHPSKPDVLIIGTGDSVAGRGMVPHPYTTSDGGKTWTRRSLPGLPDDLGPAATLEGGGDPWIAFDTTGIAYFVVNFRVPGLGSPVRLYSSSDFGITWKKAFSLGDTGGWDAPMLLALRGGVPPLLLVLGAGGKDLAPFGTSSRNATGLAVFRSDDRGASFVPAALIAPDAHAYGTEQLCQLTNGTILVLSSEFGIAPGADGTVESRYRVARSTDGGRTFDTPSVLASVPRQFPDRASLAANSSRGQFTGRVYATWESGDFGAHLSSVNGRRVREETGSHRAVSVARSDDEGRTWSRPINIEVPGAGLAYMSTVAVSASGTVGVFWLQHETYETNPRCYRAYFSASTDAGESFAPLVGVSDANSCPTRNTTEDFFTYRPRGGDYLGLAAAADGSFHAVWSDARNGVYKTFTLRIVVEK